VQDREGRQMTTLFIPHTKSSPAGEEVSWAKQDGVTDPHQALDSHIRINNPPPNGHLFAYKHKGKLCPLTRHTFVTTLSKAAKAAGLKPIQAHGIRIGATLEYLLLRVPFDVMKVKGRWASDAFIVYLRKHTQILAPYMQAHPEIQENFIRLAMPPVR
jgi:hypothetical protein